MMERIFKHWKTSVTGVLIALITAMFWLGKIDSEQWIICIGGVATAVGLLSKDNNNEQKDK